jgi:hypothetical protein
MNHLDRIKKIEQKVTATQLVNQLIARFHRVGSFRKFEELCLRDERRWPLRVLVGELGARANRQQGENREVRRKYEEAALVRIRIFERVNIAVSRELEGAADLRLGVELALRGLRNRSTGEAAVERLEPVPVPMEAGIAAAVDAKLTGYVAFDACGQRSSTLTEELANFRMILSVWSGRLIAAKQLSDLAAKRWFDGRPLLFKAESEELALALRVLENYVSRFNDLAATVEQSTLDTRPVARLRCARSVRRPVRRALQQLRLIEARAEAEIFCLSGDFDSLARFRVDQVADLFKLIDVARGLDYSATPERSRSAQADPPNSSRHQPAGGGAPPTSSAQRAMVRLGDSGNDGNVFNPVRAKKSARTDAGARLAGRKRRHD